jgi:hypothetical protein
VIAGPRPPEPNRWAKIKRKWANFRAVAHFSDFERRLSWALWILFGTAVVYCFAQHVVLINQPEVFPYGAVIGAVLYDFSMAYIGAFTFYVLVVRLPLRQDRLNVHRAIQPLAVRIVAEAWMLMQDLNLAADVGWNRPVSWRNIEEVCNKIGPASPASTPPPEVTTRVIDFIGYRLERAQKVQRELLSFSTYLSTELVNHVVELNDCGLIHLFDDYIPGFRSGRYYDDDLDFCAVQLYAYLRLADRLHQYTMRYLKNPLKIADIITADDIDPDEVLFC